MTDEQRAKLENLAFSPLDPFLSLDTHLQRFLDLIAEIEQAERERCARVCEAEAAEATRVFGEWQDGAYACAARIRALN